MWSKLLQLLFITTCNNAMACCDFETTIGDLYSETGILGLLSYPVTRRKINLHAIEDIQDGLLYKKHFGSDGYFRGTSDKKKKTEIHISFQINIDGVALFRSSKYNIWPMYLTVNELPPNCR